MFLERRPMLECEFWGKVRPKIPRPWIARRIEDSSGNLGTYDTFMACKGFPSLWLELKVANPKAKPKLRAGQPAFGRMLFDAGVPCAYLVGSDNGYVRLIGPLTTGADWRDHLMGEWDSLDMRKVLSRLLTGFD